MEYSENYWSHVFKFAGALLFRHDRLIFFSAVDTGNFRFNLQWGISTARNPSRTLEALSLALSDISRNKPTKRLKIAFMPWAHIRQTVCFIGCHNTLLRTVTDCKFAQQVNVAINHGEPIIFCVCRAFWLGHHTVTTWLSTCNGYSDVRQRVDEITFTKCNRIKMIKNEKSRYLNAIAYH